MFLLLCVLLFCPEILQEIICMKYIKTLFLQYLKPLALPVKFSDLEESDRNKSVQEGSPIALSCELSHDPSAHVDWYKDGTKLLPQHNMEIQSDGLTRTLHIHSAEDTHGGTYECSTSDDTITFTVEVKGDLSICLLSFNIYTTSILLFGMTGWAVCFVECLLKSIHLLSKTLVIPFS